MSIHLLNQSDKNILEIARKLRVPYKLKRTLRYSTTRDTDMHSESVAEHIFALVYLAQYFLPLEDPDKKLDREKVYELVVYHDFGEIPNGDRPYHLKTAEDEARERLDAESVFTELPLSLQGIGFRRWEEYEQRSTPEARFVDALDKIEPMFELFDEVSERSLKRLKFTYEHHMGKKLKVTENFPVMRRFVEVVSRDMRDRGVFWKD